MAAAPKKLKSLLFPPISTRVMAIVAFVLEILALFCLVVGIISGVKYEAIFTLVSTEWFLITIALFIYGLWWWLTAYFAAKE